MNYSLEDLHREIAEADQSNWVYPQDGDVLGFRGPGPFMLLSYRPSRNPWTESDRGRRRLYGTLARLGLRELHLSDCIKLRSSVTDDQVMPSNLDWHIGLLRREIRLINPPALIVAGGKALRFLETHLPDLELPLIPVIHYSYRFASNEEVTLDLLAGVLDSLKLLLAGKDTHRD